MYRFVILPHRLTFANNLLDRCDKSDIETIRSGLVSLYLTEGDLIYNELYTQFCRGVGLSDEESDISWFETMGLVSSSELKTKISELISYISNTLSIKRCKRSLSELRNHIEVVDKFPEPKVISVDQLSTQDANLSESERSLQVLLSTYEIRAKLDNYVSVEDPDSVEINTRLCYFTKNHEDKWVFLTGGFLKERTQSYLLLSTSPKFSGKTHVVFRSHAKFYQLSEPDTVDNLSESERSLQLLSETDEIRTELVNYSPVGDIESVEINTRLCYFIQDDKGKWRFQLGGVLKNIGTQNVILSRFAGSYDTWFVDRKTARFYSLDPQLTESNNLSEIVSDDLSKSSESGYDSMPELIPCNEINVINDNLSESESDNDDSSEDEECNDLSTNQQKMLPILQKLNQLDDEQLTKISKLLSTKQCSEILDEIDPTLFHSPTPDSTFEFVRPEANTAETVLLSLIQLKQHKEALRLLNNFPDLFSDIDNKMIYVTKSIIKNKRKLRAPEPDLKLPFVTLLMTVHGYEHECQHFFGCNELQDSSDLTFTIKQIFRFIPEIAPYLDLDTKHYPPLIIALMAKNESMIKFWMKQYTLHGIKSEDTFILPICGQKFLIDNGLSKFISPRNQWMNL